MSARLRPFGLDVKIKCAPESSLIRRSARVSPDPEKHVKKEIAKHLSQASRGT